MDSLDIPELLEIPDPAPYDVNPVATADFLMTTLLRKAPAMLHAEFHDGDGRWFSVMLLVGRSALLHRRTLASSGRCLPDLATIT
jgi:hypothetical protein